MADETETDYHGNEYDTYWFTESDLTADGQLGDEYGQYNPFAGNLEPVEGRCNATLNHWRTRYPTVRYCGRLTDDNFCKCDEGECDCSEDYCHVHRDREQLDMRAKELLQHGLNTQSREHMYEKLDPFEQLLIEAKYHDLLDDSIYEYSPDFNEREFAVGDSQYSLPENLQEDVEDGVITIDVPYATERDNRSDALWLAAVDGMKALKANAEIAESEMAVQAPAFADLNSEEEYQTVDVEEEHHLNLAYSRLVTDRKELLSFGGVATGTEADVETSTDVIEEEFVQVGVDNGSSDHLSGELEEQFQ